MGTTKQKMQIISASKKAGKPANVTRSSSLLRAPEYARHNTFGSGARFSKFSITSSRPGEYFFELIYFYQLIE